MVVNSGAEHDQNLRERASWIDLALFVLAAVFMLWGIGSYGLYEPHEAQYGGGATEMVQRGDWVTPYLNGEREVNKPPLFYWLIATSYWALARFGLRVEFVLRLPSALIALTGMALAWQWAREIWNLRAGRFAALMLAVVSGWYIFAHQLMIDELVSVLILASLYFLWKGICKPAAKWPVILFYICVGLAVLAKALIGLFFPLAIAGLFVLIRRDWALMRRSRPLLGLVIMACVIGPWAYLYEKHNPGALNYIIVNEHFKRALDTREPHDYGRVQVTVAAFLMFTAIWTSPWCLFLPQVATFSIANAFKRNGERTTVNDAILLLVLGAVLPILFFLPFPSRLIYYALPCVPPTIILCSGFWSAPDSWRGWKLNLAAGSVALLGLAAAAMTFFLPKILSEVPELQQTPALQRVIPIEAVVVGTVLLVCGLLIFLKKSRAALAGLVLLMSGLELFNVHEFATFDSITSSKKMVKELAPKVGDDCVWISEGSDEVGAAGGTAFYLRQYTNDKAAQVLIMDEDPSRPPPKYPGPPLHFFNRPQAA